MFASRRQGPQSATNGQLVEPAVLAAPVAEEAPKGGAFDAVAEKILGVKFSDLALIGKSTAAFLQEARERLDRLEANQAESAAQLLRIEAGQARIEAWLVKTYAQGSEKSE